MRVEIDGVVLDAFFDDDGNIENLYAGDVDILPMIDTICGGNLKAFEAEIERAQEEAADYAREDAAFDRLMDRALDRLGELRIR